MIFVDASQLSSYLRESKPVTGIQRLTLNSLVGLRGALGDQAIKALVYDDVLRAFRSLSVADLFSGKAGEPAFFTAQDSILLMEWYWNKGAFEAGLVAGKDVGARQFRFIHDVIPVARPDLVRPANTRRFRANTERAIAAADVILTNSEFSRGDINKHFHGAANRLVHAVKLPHEFTIVNAEGQVSSIGPETPLPIAKVRSRIAALANTEFVLMVGTLEERKNTHLAVQAWKRLKTRLPNLPMLVLVGFYSAHSLRYTAKLLSGIYLNRKILHLPDCSDLELAWLYQHCRFTIYISQYEGWGLPIGESLWFGKPVVSQRQTSLPEVGGNVVDYATEAEVVQSVSRLLNDASYCLGRVQQIGTTRWRTNSDFAKSLAQAILAT